MRYENYGVINMTQILILTEAALFTFAALIHFGKFVKGYEHKKARIAESVIAFVLLTGFSLGLLRPIWTHNAAVAVQLFALSGTCVGLFTIVIGVGPRTKPDIIFHSIIIIVLVLGLVVTGFF